MGERRFAASVAKKLSQLGALTKGDRRGCSEGVDLAQFDKLLGKWGNQGVDDLWDTIERRKAATRGLQLACNEQCLVGKYEGSDFATFAAETKRALSAAGCHRATTPSERADSSKKLLNKVSAAVTMSLHTVTISLQEAAQ